MEIFDEKDNLISPSDVNGHEGYLEVEEVFVKHHPAIAGIDEIGHYEPIEFHFTDNTSYTPIGLDDPHIVVLNNTTGEFSFQSLGDYDDKELDCVNVQFIVDQKGQPSVDAWDEYKYIQRYKLFTEAEKEKKRIQEKEEEVKENFLRTGAAKLEKLEQRVAELEKLIK